MDSRKLNKNYRHIFFDLDHTLWDFEVNATEVLQLIYSEFRLGEIMHFQVKDFVEKFHQVNANLWKQHDLSLIDKDELRESRFPRIFSELGASPELMPADISAYYLENCPKGKAIRPYSKEILDHLHQNYHLHILSNGFEDVQQVKLESSGLLHYFDQIVTPDKAGAKKPDPEIFRFALEKAGASLADSLMIGDNLETDIHGAIESGMDYIYYNPLRIPHELTLHKEIFCLSELLDLL